MNVKRKRVPGGVGDVQYVSFKKTTGEVQSFPKYVMRLHLEACC